MSAESGEVVMNIDIGGGSSNIAVCKDGHIIATTAVNVGGRLIAFDNEDQIVRLEETGRKLAAHLGIELEVGDTVEDSVKSRIAGALADALIETIRGENSSEVTSMLMMAKPLIYNESPDRITFSGGVAEYFYGAENRRFNDLGVHLAEELKKRSNLLKLPLGTPEHRIRATVIGAGHFSLQVSGSTTFLSSGLEYPVRNLPVVAPLVTRGRNSQEEVRKAIESALTRFDLREGEDPLILAFNDAVRPSYEKLTEFAKGVVSALPNTVRAGRPIMMCFDSDVGNSVGNIMRRETGVTNEILSIDEISLKEGDFIDIGSPIIEDVVVPVVVKTLVFDSQD